MAFDPTLATSSYGWEDGYQTVLTNSMTDTQLTCELTVLPTPTEGTIVIEPGTDNEEEIYYTSKGTGLVNIPSISQGRGVNGTAKAHNAGVAVKMLVTKASMDVIKNLNVTNVNTLLADQKKGWNTIDQTLTYQSATTLSGTDLTENISVGNPFKCDQEIPLTSYWSFDTNSTDAKGAATMNNVGTPTYTAGKFSNALTLNGSDQALAITDAAAFKPTGAFSLGFWSNAISTVPSKVPFQSYSDNTNSNGIIVWIDSSGHINIAFGNNAASASSTLTGTTDLNGAWHRVLISSQNNHTKIFVDGVIEVQGYTVTPTYAATNYVRIGCKNETGSNTDWFKGQIDDLFFINGHAVDQYWAAADYAAGSALGSGNITATYKGYVTAVTDTLLTVNGGADYSLYNGTITSPYYSKASSPVGFPANSNTFSPLGVCYAENSADQGPITSVTDLTNLSIATNTPNKRIRINAQVALTSSATGDRVVVAIQEGATVLRYGTTVIASGGQTQTTYFSHTFTPTAGAHTYKLTAQRGAGSGNVTISGTGNYGSFISAEII